MLNSITKFAIETNKIADNLQNKDSTLSRVNTVIEALEIQKKGVIE